MPQGSAAAQTQEDCLKSGMGSHTSGRRMARSHLPSPPRCQHTSCGARRTPPAPMRSGTPEPVTRSASPRRPAAADVRAHQSYRVTTQWKPHSERSRCPRDQHQPGLHRCLRTVLAGRSRTPDPRGTHAVQAYMTPPGPVPWSISSTTRTPSSVPHSHRGVTACRVTADPPDQPPPRRVPPAVHPHPLEVHAPGPAGVATARPHRRYVWPAALPPSRWHRAPQCHARAASRDRYLEGSASTRPAPTCPQ